MKLFNKHAIELFCEKSDEDSAVIVAKNITDVLEENFCKIALKNRVAGKFVKTMPACELFNNSWTLNSTITLLFVFESSQIEFNTVKMTSNKFYAFLKKVKLAWKNRNSNTKKAIKKEKKQAKNKNFTKTNIQPEKYDISALQKDFFNEILNYFSNETTIVLKQNMISILASQDLGFNIDVYFALSTEKNLKFKFIDSIKNKIIEVDFTKRRENLQKKSVETAGKIYPILRCLNNLYYNLIGCMPSQMLMESLLYNSPNCLFGGENNCENLISIVNFINFSNICSFVSILDNKTKLFDDKIINANISSVSKFFKTIGNVFDF
ncbi:MAG: hypothetical protein RR140_01725 [Clostridia bacterium]